MGALSGNRLRPNAVCSCYRSRLVDPLNARLPDRMPPRRGRPVEPSSTGRLAQSAAIRLFVAVRPAGSDEGASAHRARRTPNTALGPFSVRRSDPAPSARRRFVRQPSVRRVSVLPNRHHQPCSAATGWRTNRLSSRRQSLNQHGVSRRHVGAIRRPVRPCCDGAEGGRGVVSHDSQGLAQHHVRMTEPRLVGTPILLTCKARPAAPL